MTTPSTPRRLQLYIDGEFVGDIDAGQVIVNANNAFWDVNIPFGGARALGGGSPEKNTHFST